MSRLNDWWLVASDTNWMEHPSFTVQELFGRVVAAPELGPNSMRAEVILAASQVTWASIPSPAGSLSWADSTIR